MNFRVVTDEQGDVYFPVARFAHPSACKANAHLGEPLPLPDGYTEKGEQRVVAFFVLPADASDDGLARADKLQALLKKFAKIKPKGEEEEEGDARAQLHALQEFAREAFCLYTDEEFEKDIRPRLRLEYWRGIVYSALFGQAFDCRLAKK